MTVLEACLEVLKSADRPLNAREILGEIESRKLYAFKAKDRGKVVSGAIRNNLRKGAPPLIIESEKGKYQVNQQSAASR